MPIKRKAGWHQKYKWYAVDLDGGAWLYIKLPFRDEEGKYYNQHDDLECSPCNYDPLSAGECLRIID